MRGSGFCITEKGYVRVTAGPNRNKFKHRVVMEGLAKEYCFYSCNPKSGLPDGFHVEHIDHKKAHNCHQNLLLIQDIIHNYCSAWTRWNAKGDVDWKAICGVRDEVPF